MVRKTCCIVREHLDTASALPHTFATDLHIRVDVGLRVWERLKKRCGDTGAGGSDAEKRGEGLAGDKKQEEEHREEKGEGREHCN